ncbi:carbohydrate ABC transporter permease [Alicyclobacillus herbarius]|uniref:carbohydrate ABC transporter permease n=1 Tax=Alicyclobacillus herbarius TaxID=122960 RepID=UPI00041B20D4|nr:sugar ABC transporter permease [Alicyclobacillus herbarius]
MAKTITSSATSLASISRVRVSRQAVPYLFLSPFLVIFAIFLIYPILDSLYLSFTSAQGSTSQWIGLDNYRKLLTDTSFWKSLLNTAVILVVQVPVMLFLGTLLAAALNSKLIRGRAFFRLAVFLPVLIDTVTYSIVFSNIFNSHYGILNYLLGLVGVAPIDWLNTPVWARIAIIIALTWRWTGYNAIILLAGLQAIPESIAEAATMDGAGRVAQFFRITLPMLKPVLLFCAILSTNGTLQLFTEPYLLTNGGPANATETPVMYIYQFAFQSFHFGYACAAAYVLTVIVAVLSFLQFRVSKGGEIG